jgi:hypothetical protein
MLFQVFLNRGLTPEQGQEFLRRMSKKIDNSPAPTPGAPGTVKMPGITRYDDSGRPVFPDWLANALRDRCKLEYDYMNLCYFKRYASEQDARAMMTWFDNSFRPWMMKVFFQYADTLKNLQVRVMDEHDSLGDAQTY